MAPDLRKQGYYDCNNVVGNCSGKGVKMPRPLIGREPLAVKTFRVEPTVWELALKRAKQDRIGIGQLVRIALMEYLTRNPVDRELTSTSDDDRIALGMAHAAEAHVGGLPAPRGVCSTCDYYLG